MRRYVLLSHDSKTGNTFYYDEMTGQICLLENKKSEKGLSVGVIAGLSILIYVFVRRIENPVSIDKYVLYWVSLWMGSPQASFFLYMVLDAQKEKLIL